MDIAVGPCGRERRTLPPDVYTRRMRSGNGRTDAGTTIVRQSSVAANRAPLAAGRLNSTHVTIDSRVSLSYVSFLSEDYQKLHAILTRLLLRKAYKRRLREAIF